MKWKTTRLAALTSAFFIAATAAYADFAVVQREIEVNEPAEEVWAKVGDYCAISEWLDLDCTYLFGDGSVGTNRALAGGRIEEVMVAQTDHSYTYIQTVGNMAERHYTGTLNVEPVTDTTSRILYTLVWDESGYANDEERNTARTNFETRFQTAIETMKAMAEAP
jgi:hypothetical protein